MNNPYRKLMEQQHLSDQAKQAFYYNLQHSERKKTHSFILKVVTVAACILLLIPITAYAVEQIFDVSLVEMIKGVSFRGKDATGYEVTYPELSNRPLSDFPEEIQTMDGHRLAIYNSWDQAEEELGITLVNNAFFDDKSVERAYAYDLKYDGILKHVHCFTHYNGLDNQFYSAAITAAYRYDNMHITLDSVVTCDHPAISKEDALESHWSSVIYETEDVEQILQEQYTAANGVTANIVTVDRTGSKSTDYEATFSAKGASYRITIHSYDKGRDAEVKDTLIRILEGFIF